MPDLSCRIAEVQERLGIRIEHLVEITSTNDLAADPGRNAGDVVWAEVQTKGRGQRGNSWSSGAGENLTFSLILQPYLPAGQQFYISKIVSVGLIEALTAFDLPAEIKWPNDLYVGDRKTAGILIENDLQGAHIVKSVIGIGLNVNQLSFDPALPNPTSMRLATGKMFDRVAVLETVLERIFEWEKYLWEGRYAAVDEMYAGYLFRKSGTHRFQEPGGEPFEAVIEAVRPSGELILRPKDGPPKSYLFKEVEFIIKKSE